MTGAAKALRGMWPLVFSKVEAVRDAVLDSWNILHLRSRSPRDQVSAGVFVFNSKPLQLCAKRESCVCLRRWACVYCHLQHVAGCVGS